MNRQRNLLPPTPKRQVPSSTRRYSALLLLVLLALVPSCYKACELVEEQPCLDGQIRSCQCRHSWQSGTQVCDELGWADCNCVGDTDTDPDTDVDTDSETDTEDTYTDTDIDTDMDTDTDTQPVDPPGIPTRVTATAGNLQFRISWAAVPTAETYNVYWTANGTRPSKTNGTKTAGIANDFYTHLGLTGGVEYRYAITAVNAAGESDVSSVVHGWAWESRTVAGIAFAWIPPGTFQMGSENGESDEVPVHTVEITQGFYISQLEITQQQYKEVVGEVSSCDSYCGQNLPAHPRWGETDAVEFRESLTAKTGMLVRRPTEAEWEYACRAGTTTEYHFGDTFSANLASCDTDQVVDVGSFPPNQFGLHDMSGSTWEPCQDWYDPEYYPSSPPADPPGPASGTAHVLRGGSHNGMVASSDCRSADRLSSADTEGDFDTIGIRVIVECLEDYTCESEGCGQICQQTSDCPGSDCLIEAGQNSGFCSTPCNAVDVGDPTACGCFWHCEEWSGSGDTSAHYCLPGGWLPSETTPCEEKYAPELICDEDAGSCTFYHEFKPGDELSNCEEVCSAQGGHCISASTNPELFNCQMGFSRPCDTEDERQMRCTCSMW